MKKLIIILGIVLLFFITSCSAVESERKEIIEFLIKEKVLVGKNFKEIDKEHYTQYSGWFCEAIDYYIYENSKGNRVAITFDKKSEENADVFKVNVYKNVVEETNLEYYDEKPDGCIDDAVYTTDEVKYTKNPKYILDNYETYKVTKKGKKYNLEKQN